MSDPRSAYEAWHSRLAVDEAADAPWHDLARQHLADLTGFRVLEIGCGRGGFSAWLARQGVRTVVAADFARSAVRMARDFTRELSFDVTDPTPPPGACSAYWLRITQEDGAQAWTSPVYLTAE